MKYCKYCSKEKPVSEFNTHSQTRDRLDSRCKQCRRQYGRNYPNGTKQLRLSAIKVLGEQCVRCEFTDIRALQIDHVNGGGAKEVRELGHVREVYKKIVAHQDLDMYQVLCANCNQIKRAELQEDGTSNYRVPLEDSLLILT